MRSDQPYLLVIFALWEWTFLFSNVKPYKICSQFLYFEVLLLNYIEDLYCVKILWLNRLISCAKKERCVASSLGIIASAKIHRSSFASLSLLSFVSVFLLLSPSNIFQSIIIRFIGDTRLPRRPRGSIEHASRPGPRTPAAKGEANRHSEDQSNGRMAAAEKPSN